MIGKQPERRKLLLLSSRAWAFVARPEQAWQALGPPPSAWHAPLLGHVLPLAFLPAIGWAVGTSIHPLPDSAATRSAGSDRDASLYSAVPEAIAITVLLCMLSVALFAIAIHWVAPMYRVRRDWTRAMEVAAYGSTPVLLAGVFLLWPVLILVGVVALLPCCHIVYIGLQARMGCSADDAVAYAVVATVLATMMSMLLGAAGSALGLI